MRIPRQARRLGCGLLVILWFALLILVPCGVFTLIAGGEIRVAHSAVPDDNWLRIWSIQEAKLRGLGISTGYTVNPDANSVCTITDTRFLLWLGQSPGGRSYACYTKQADTYAIISTGNGNPPDSLQVPVTPSSVPTEIATP